MGCGVSYLWAVRVPEWFYWVISTRLQGLIQPLIKNPTKRSYYIKKRVIKLMITLTLIVVKQFNNITLLYK